MERGKMCVWGYVGEKVYVVIGLKKRGGRKKEREIIWGHGRTSKAKKGKRECVYVWEERYDIKKEEGCVW
jgi:hypothetical protein